MHTLMERLEPKEVGGRAEGRRGAFALPKHGGDIIVAIMCRFFANIRCLGEDVVVGDGASKFQITVGDITSWIRKRYEPVCDPFGEGLAPQQWGDAIMCGDKMDPSHTATRCVTGAKRVGCCVWYQFGDSSWSRRKIFRQEPEIIEKAVRGF